MKDWRPGAPDAPLASVDGAEIPLGFSSLEQELRALRRSVVLSDTSHVGAFRLTGDDAYDVLDRFCPIPLLLRDGQMRHTLLLDDQGQPFVDLFACNDDEEFILLTEGATPQEVQAYIEPFLDGDCGLVWLGESHAMLSLNGPFAWELMSRIIGPESIGFPYLSFYHPSPQQTIFRAGKSGEYSYDLLIPHEQKAELWERICERGAEFDLRCAGWEALELATFEACFFQPHRYTGLELTPLELQLQWRISYDKSYPGSEALLARRAQGIASRLTAFVSEGPVSPGDEVRCGPQSIGAVASASFSPTLQHTIGQALLQLPWAHSGISGLRAGDDGVELRTVSAPFVNNLSLYVNPQQHSYAERAAVVVPA